VGVGHKMMLDAVIPLAHQCIDEGLLPLLPMV
jgi:hypothetical protein